MPWFQFEVFFYSGKIKIIDFLSSSFWKLLRPISSWNLEVVCIKKILAKNWPIGICLHSVRRSLWIVSTMSTQMSSSPYGLKGVPTPNCQFSRTFSNQSERVRLFWKIKEQARSVVIDGKFWIRNWEFVQPCGDQLLTKIGNLKKSLT